MIKIKTKFPSRLKAVKLIKRTLCYYRIKLNEHGSLIKCKLYLITITQYTVPPQPFIKTKTVFIYL